MSKAVSRPPVSAPLQLDRERVPILPIAARGAPPPQGLVEGTRMLEVNGRQPKSSDEGPGRASRDQPGCGANDPRGVRRTRSRHTHSCHWMGSATLTQAGFPWPQTPPIKNGGW